MLTKAGASRYHLARTLVRNLRRERRHLLALRAAGEQAMRFAIDAVAITTRLNHRLLLHRAQPITPAEAAEWKSVWRSIHREPLMNYAR
jgi:hypothetical protein